MKHEKYERDHHEHALSYNIFRKQWTLSILGK